MHAGIIMTDTGISLFLDGQSYAVQSDHPQFEKIKDALNRKAWAEAKSYMNIAEAAHNWIATDKEFALIDGAVVYQGEPFSAPVTDKVLRMLRAGLDPSALLNFLRKVRQNPSASAQRELLLFCEANRFAIHEDGDLIAYKAVRADYRDMHSGKFDNSIGKVVTMPRHSVDDRRNVTCSYGLHFAAYEYAAGFGGQHVVVLKINPADVVSIPSDYNNQKGRCCRYEVIDERKDFTPLPEAEVYGDRELSWDYEEGEDEEEEDPPQYSYGWSNN